MAGFKAARGSLGFRYFKGAEYDWLFKRVLIAAPAGGAEIGECLVAARSIRERDPDSWVDAWAGVGEQVEAHARHSLATGHRVSAREGLARATTYFRAAEYLAAAGTGRAHELWTRSREAFAAAAELFDPPIRAFNVSFAGATLPGWFWPAREGAVAPTFFHVGGNDDSGEEGFFWNGPAAHARGYNWCTVEYPGHRGAVHMDATLHKRVDQEVPFASIFDALERLPETDGRVALAGHSHGGYVVCRVTACEPRVAAVIPSSPLVDADAAGEAMMGRVRGLPRGLVRLGLRYLRWRDPAVGRMLDYTLWTLGRSFDELLDSLDDPERPRFALGERLADITCPCLALVGEGDGPALLAQAEAFIAGVSSRDKTLHHFRIDPDLSDDHCQLDNRLRANQVQFDWLDQRLW